LALGASFFDLRKEDVHWMLHQKRFSPAASNFFLASGVLALFMVESAAGSPLV